MPCSLGALALYKEALSPIVKHLSTPLSINKNSYCYKCYFSFSSSYLFSVLQQIYNYIYILANEKEGRISMVTITLRFDQTMIIDSNLETTRNFLTCLVNPPLLMLWHNSYVFMLILLLFFYDLPCFFFLF